MTHEIELRPILVGSVNMRNLVQNENKVVTEQEDLHELLSTHVWTSEKDSYDFFNTIVTPKRIGLEKITLLRFIQGLNDYPHLCSSNLEEAIYAGLVHKNTNHFTLLTNEFKVVGGLMLPQIVFGINDKKISINKKFHSFYHPLNDNEEFLLKVLK